MGVPLLVRQHEQLCTHPCSETGDHCFLKPARLKSPKGMQQMKKSLLKKIQNVVRRVSMMFEPRPRRTETPDQCSQEHRAPSPHSSQSEGYHLGKPGCQLFSSCPQPPVADAKFWVMLLKGKVLPSAWPLLVGWILYLGPVLLRVLEP